MALYLKGIKMRIEMDNLIITETKDYGDSWYTDINLSVDHKHNMFSADSCKCDKITGLDVAQSIRCSKEVIKNLPKNILYKKCKIILEIEEEPKKEEDQPMYIGRIENKINSLHNKIDSLHSLIYNFGKWMEKIND